MSAKELLEWNGVLPTLGIAEDPTSGATQFYTVTADYGWAERILCARCYLQDAEAIVAACNEAMGTSTTAELGSAPGTSEAGRGSGGETK